MDNVYAPSTHHAVFQSYPWISSWATKGMMVRPVPWVTPNHPRTVARRRTNQLLRDVDGPSSNGLAKAMRPGM